MLKYLFRMHFPTAAEEEVAFKKVLINEELRYGMLSELFVKGNTQLPILEYIGTIYDLADEKDLAKWNRQFSTYNKLRDSGDSECWIPRTKLLH